MSNFSESLGFPSGSDGKESACNVGDWGSIPGSGRCPGEGNGYLLQYSCLADSMDRGAWWATVHRAAKESDKTDHTCTQGFFCNLYETDFCIWSEVVI